MAKRHKDCGKKVKRVISVTDSYPYKIRTYYCKHCKRMINESEIEK